MEDVVEIVLPSDGPERRKLDHIEQKLEELMTDFSKLKAVLADLAVDGQAAAADITAKDAEIAAKDAKITELEAGGSTDEQPEVDALTQTAETTDQELKTATAPPADA